MSMVVVGDGAGSVPRTLDFWARCCTPHRRTLTNLLIQFRPAATPLADLSLGATVGYIVRGGLDVAVIV